MGCGLMDHLVNRDVRKTYLETSPRATVCYMKEITHRQMRNESASLLRQVEAGETILILNSGQPAAIIGPPSGDIVSLLAARGQLRQATAPPASLRNITRRKTTRSAAEILNDSRGRW